MARVAAVGVSPPYAPAATMTTTFPAYDPRSVRCLLAPKSSLRQHVTSKFPPVSNARDGARLHVASGNPRDFHPRATREGEPRVQSAPRALAMCRGARTRGVPLRRPQYRYLYRQRRNRTLHAALPVERRTTNQPRSDSPNAENPDRPTGAAGGTSPRRYPLGTKTNESYRRVRARLSSHYTRDYSEC